MASTPTPREELARVIQDQQARITELEALVLKQSVALSKFRNYNAHTDRWGPASTD